MRRKFNVTGSCNPQRHYMVKLDDRLKRIKEEYVDEGAYFVINKGRQYGKTTVLNALKRYLKRRYMRIHQGIRFSCQGSANISMRIFPIQTVLII